MDKKKQPKRKAKKDKKHKPVNWAKALAKALEQESDRDAQRAVEIIRELHYLVIVKHGKPTP